MSEFYVRHLMNSAEVITLPPTEGVWNAYKKMKAEGFRHIPIVDKNKKIVGILSDRNVINCIAGLSDRKSLNDPIIKDHMTKNPYCCNWEDPAKLAASMMLNHKVDCLPVVDDKEKVIGIVTSYDLLRLAAAL